MATHTLAINLQVSDDTLAGILTTAIEGGTGYWLTFRHLQRDEELNVLEAVHVRDAETGKRFDAENFAPGIDPVNVITLQTVRLGLERILSPTYALPSHATPHASFVAAILSELRDPEDSAGVYIDASVADVIIQMGLFGQVVFG